MTTLDEALEQATAAAENPSADAAKEVAVAAAAAVVANAKGALSPEALAMAGNISAAAQTVLAHLDTGRLAAAAKQSAGAFAAEAAMQGVTAIVGAMGAAGPIGVAMAAAYSVFLGIGGVLADDIAQAMASRVAWVRQRDDELFGAGALSVFLRPRGTGAGGRIVPADLIAYQRFPAYKSQLAGCKESFFRPAVGATLIKLTENGLDDGEVRAGGSVGIEPYWDAEAKALGPCHARYGGVSAQYYDWWLKGVRALLKDERVGIPLERRKVFRLLRQAIQLQHEVQGTDGGASLWPAYLDLLRDAFARGWLPADPIALDTLLFTEIDWNYDTPGQKRVEISTEWNKWQHPSTMPLVILEMLRQWDTAIAPVYAQDATARSEQARLYDALGKVAALKAAGATSVPPSLLVGIPPEMQKQLGVTIRPGILSPAQQKRAKELRDKGLTPAQVLEQLGREAAGPRTGLIAAAGIAAAGIAAAVAYAATRKKT